MESEGDETMRANLPNIIMILLGLLVILIIPYQISEASGGTVLGPRFFPYLLGIGIILFSVISMFSTGKEPSAIPKEDQEMTGETEGKKDYLRTGLLFVSILFWILVVPIAGFIITTTLVTMAAMILIGCRKKLTLGWVPLAFSLVVYYVFAILLHIALPEILI